MMDWLRENLFWIVLTVLFVWMHLKMHGGHGGHGGGGCHGGHGEHGEHGGLGGNDREPQQR